MHRPRAAGCCAVAAAITTTGAPPTTAAGRVPAPQRGAAMSRQVAIRPARALAVSTRMTAALTIDANAALAFIRAATADVIALMGALSVTSSTSTPALRERMARAA